tara:strand:- start:12 stop:1460 length:1449 start_codon:yes stop_codon:yes gene_type:complete
MTDIPNINQQAEVSDGNSVFDDVWILNKLHYDFTKSGTINVSELNVIGVSTFSSDVTFSGDITLDEITCRNANVTGIATVIGDLYLTGAFRDSSGDTGTSGKLLESTGSGTNWVAANATSVANAINVGVNLNGTNADQFVSFFGANSGNQPNRVDGDFTYNPSTNTMSGINYSGTSSFTNINVSTASTVSDLYVNGRLYDKDGQSGNSGQVLSSTGTKVDWINVGSISAGSAAQVAVTNTTSGSHFLTFVDSTSGNEDVRANSNLTYNTSTQEIGGKISDISNHNTGDLSEGSNLYHTTARARAAISASGDLSYNNSTGVMSFSAPSAFVSGMIILWSGNTGNIPTGFVLCNGQNGTPDLRNRFIVGAGDVYSPGATGGLNEVEISQAQLPAHNHSASSSSSVTDSGHVHSTSFDGKKYFPGGGSTSIGFGGAGGYPADVFSMNSQTTGISVNTTTTIGNTGSGQGHENRPPYYALCYIMKT